MADIARDGDQIVLKLSIGERILAVHPRRREDHPDRLERSMCG